MVPIRWQSCPNHACQLANNCQFPATCESPRRHEPGIYIASKTRHAWRWRQLRDERKVVLSCTWINEAEVGQTADFQELWTRIHREVGQSKAVICYARGEDFPLKGALIEAGMGLAMGKKVFLVLEKVVIEPHTYRPIGSWIMHPSVVHCKDIEAALGEIARL